MSRKYTNKILEMMDEGLLDPKWLVECLAVWCSEQDMKEFYEQYVDDIDDEDEE